MRMSDTSTWGDNGPLPDNGVVVYSNSELRTVVESSLRKGKSVPPIGLLGGDLCRTLGGRGERERLFKPEAIRLQVDLGVVLLDGKITWFCSHVIAGSLWEDRFWIAANAAYYGHWNIAPRAHPGDGVIDVLDFRLTFKDRLMARKKMYAGIHIPHPRISYRRLPALQMEFDRPTRLKVDGENFAKIRQLSVRLDVGALRLVL